MSSLTAHAWRAQQEMIGENQPNKYRATCCGIRKDPPTLYVRYKVIATGVIRSRRIYLKGVDAKTTTELAQILWSKHKPYLEDAGVSMALLTRVLERLKSSVTSASASAPAAAAAAPTPKPAQGQTHAPAAATTAPTVASRSVLGDLPLLPGANTAGVKPAAAAAAASSVAPLAKTQAPTPAMPTPEPAASALAPAIRATAASPPGSQPGSRTVTPQSDSVRSAPSSPARPRSRSHSPARRQSRSASASPSRSRSPSHSPVRAGTRSPSRSRSPSSRHGKRQSRSPSRSRSRSPSRSRSRTPSTVSDGSIAEDIEIDQNLNALSDQELEAHKARMDIAFEKNRLSPSDPNFEYDRRVDFKPKQASTWDEDESEEEDQW